MAADGDRTLQGSRLQRCRKGNSIGQSRASFLVRRPRASQPRVVTVAPGEAAVGLLLRQAPGGCSKAGPPQEAGPPRSNSAASRSALPSFASVPDRIPSPVPTFASAAPPNPPVANLSPPPSRRGRPAPPSPPSGGREAPPRSSWARPVSGSGEVGVVGRGGCRWCSGREGCRPG